MDSLHPSLSQALPLRDYDAEQALQAPFRAAALGIATFYKKASENGRKAYSLGYSSALQDVLAHLQTALDQLDSPNSQDSMASTIQRVVDYIQRRQEALRAESQEPNDEDGAAQPSPAPQQGHRQSTTPPSRSTLSPTSEQAPPPTTTQQPTSTAPPALEPCPSAPQSTRRRTSPRRMTPVIFQPSNSSGFGPDHSPPSPTSTSAVSRPSFNLNFSSFSASPLPQHQQPSSTGPTTTSSSRRHRSGPTEGARKGKLKERANERSSATTLDSVGLLPHGYSHYTPSTTSSSAGDPKTLSSIGNKRRFPGDSNLDSSPLNVPPQPVRITRRTPTLPMPSKSLATPIDHPLNQPPSSQSPDQLVPPPTQIHLHAHPHHDQDDVLMLLQASPDLHDNHPHQHHHHHQDGIERASKRFFTYKNLY